MERLSKLKIKTRLIASNLIIIILACTAIFYSIFNIERLDNNIDLMDNSILPVVTETQNINRNIITVERNLLEMTLTEDLSRVDELMNINNVKGGEVDQSITALKEILSGKDIEEVEHFTKDIMVLRDIRLSIENVLIESDGEDWQKAEQIIRNKYMPLSSDVRNDLDEFSKKINSSLKESIETSQKMAEFGEGIAVALAIIFIIAAFFMLRKIIKDIMNPLREIETATKALSNGDFSQDITYDNSDEFGQVCNSMRESFSELKGIISEITTIFNAMAEGDFTVRTDVSFPGELKQIEISANTLIEKINVAFNEIKISSEQINLGAE